MRIDPKGTIAGYPAVDVRDALRRLRVRAEWDLRALECATRLSAGQARKFVQALVAAGLVEIAAKGRWELTQAGQSLSSATAAARVKRATAEKVLREFLGRVDQVNKRPYYLGKVVTVVLFGSMLKPEVDRVSDVDVAIKVVPKETDSDRARVKNWRRVRELEQRGHRFRGLLGPDFCWYWEVFEFLEEGSRVISLIDLKHEGEFVLSVPHRHLYSAGAWSADAPARAVPRRRYVRLPDEDELF
jgi:predicted nucleotidyltransferase